MDVVTLGETMVLFVPSTIGPLRYISRFEKTIGGAESNVAIGLARLGHQAGWVSRLGNDEFGLYVLNFIRGEGIDTSRVILDNDHSTAVFFKERHELNEPKVYYYRKGSAASYMGPEDLDESYIASAKFLHITGITPALSKSCRETVYAAIKLARKHQVTVVFDPNIRLKLWSSEEARMTLMDICKLCDIVMPGIDEGKLITGESHPEKIADALLCQGAKVVIIKLGEEGAYFQTHDEKGYIPAIKVSKVVDAVGAGDAFAAGLLSGLIRGSALPEAVQLGNRVASFALTVTGDVDGLPSWEQVNPNRKTQEVYR